MRVQVDRGLCQGHGVCEGEAPDDPVPSEDPDASGDPADGASPVPSGDAWLSDPPRSSTRRSDARDGAGGASSRAADAS